VICGNCDSLLHWFLQEQREGVASMSDLLSVVERAAESNILLAEDYLARTTVGDQGAPRPARHGSRRRALTLRFRARFGRQLEGGAPVKSRSR
jgi:hypothetical protein